MPAEVPARRPMLGGVLVIVGGVLAAIGGSMEWGKLTDPAGGAPLTIKGGPLGIALGLGLALFGVLLIVVSAKGLRILFGILALLGGLFMGLVGILALSNDLWASMVVDAVPDQLGIPFSDAERQAAVDELVGSIESGAIGKEVNVTLYGLPIGALLAVVGSIVGLATAGKGGSQPIPAAFGTGVPGSGFETPPMPGTSFGQPPPSAPSVPPPADPGAPPPPPSPPQMPDAGTTG